MFRWKTRLLDKVEHTINNTSKSIKNTALIPQTPKVTQVSKKLVNGVPVMKGEQLFWAPKHFESRTKQNIPEDDILNYLPPPPAHNLNPLIPEHAQKHAELLDIMDKHLPKYDILRMPVWTNRPWFDYALYSYLFFLSIAVILFGKWDDLNEGEDHVFSGIRTFVFTRWDAFTKVDDEKVEKKFRDLAVDNRN